MTDLNEKRIQEKSKEIINDYMTTNIENFEEDYNKTQTEEILNNTEKKLFEQKLSINKPIEPYKVIYIADRKSKRYYTTVVTTLFRFNKSKHSDEKYEKWSDTLLASVSVPLIAYVDTYWADKIIKKYNKYNVTGEKGFLIRNF